MPWLWVHTVSRPFSNNATAAEGPIEPCIWYGRSNRAESVRAASGGGSAGPGNRLVARHAIDHRKAHSLVRGQAFEDVPRIEPVAAQPVGRRGEALSSLDGGVFVAGGDGEKTAVAHDMDLGVGQPPERRLVQPVEPGVVVGRADHSGMQHAGKLHVVHEVRFAGDDLVQAARGDASADPSQPVGRLDHRVGVDRNPERLAAGQVPIRRRAIGRP